MLISSISATLPVFPQGPRARLEIVAHDQAQRRGRF